MQTSSLPFQTVQPSGNIESIPFHRHPKKMVPVFFQSVSSETSFRKIVCPMEGRTGKRFRMALASGKKVEKIPFFLLFGRQLLPLRIIFCIQVDHQTNFKTVFRNAIADCFASQKQFLLSMPCSIPFDRMGLPTAIASRIWNPIFGFANQKSGFRT